MSSVGRSARVFLLAGLAVVGLAAVSTVSLAAVTGAFDNTPTTTPRCSAPALPGAVVSVQLIDMRSRMGRGPMMGGGSMMSQHDWRHFRRGMMRVVATPTTVPHGAVSLRVANTGYLVHELVALPLPAGQQVGQRVPGADGKVPETNSLGESSSSCAAGAGDGIAPGSTGWVMLHLPAGRYELVCNLPGHYVAGMFTELDVA